MILCCHALSFGKYWFSESHRSSKCQYDSLYHIKYHIHFHYWSYQDSHEVLVSCQAHHGEYTCPKLQIFTLQLKFYLWQQILSVIIFEVIGSFYSFSRKCLPNAQVWITIASSVHNSSRQLSPCPNEPQYFGITQKCFKSTSLSFSCPVSGPCHLATTLTYILPAEVGRWLFPP